MTKSLLCTTIYQKRFLKMKGILAMCLLNLFFVTSQAQNALNFDGTNDYVNCGNAASLQLNTGTIEAWIKTSNAGTGFRAIVVKNSAYGLFMNDNILIGYSWGATGIITTNIALNDNQWHHVAMSFQSGVTNGTRIYIDGVLRATSLLTVSAQTVGLSIGAGAATGGQNFTGNIDDVRVWNTVRTATEIANNRSCELAGTETGLVSYYKMNQGTAGGTNTGITTLTDAKNANNGTLTNFALTGTTSNWVASAAFSSVSIAATATTIAYGTSVTFTATASGGTSPTYQWKRNGVNVGTNSTTYTNAALDNNDIITCTVTSTSTCSTPLTAISNSITMTITTPQANVLNFDGIDDYVNCGNTASMQLNTATIEGWIKTSDAGAGFRGIVCKRLAFGLFLNNNTLIGYSWGASGTILNTGVALNDNQWHHVAMSFQSGVTNGTNIYIDGVLVTTTQFAVSNQGEDLTIGSGSTSSQYFTGSIEEVRIWNTVRTATEIANNRSCDLVGNESGLVAYYKMNQASAGGTNTGRTTLTDNTGNANSGTLTNFALTGTTSNWMSSVSVVASATNITSGTSVTFTASPNIGTSPTYQWKKNGSNVGTNSTSYTDATLLNGDVISCVVTSTSTCSTSLSGTSNSLTMTVTPAANNALNFDGTNDYVTLPNIDPISSGTAGQYTVETWVRLNAYTSGLGGWIYGDEASNNGGIIIQINDAGYIWTYRAATGIVTSTAQVPLNTWTHIAFVQDDSNLKLYVNGVFIQNLLSGANRNLEVTNTPTIGGLSNGRYLNGTLDEMRIWNVARTAAEIADAYTCQATGSEPGLLAYYRFNQGLAEGTNTGLVTLADVTTNANNGTLSNFTLTGTTSNWVAGNTFTTLTPSVSITANPTGTIDIGTSVTFTATPTNGGSSPTYQWKKNGNNVGSNQNTYTDPALANGDAIMCIMASSIACAAPTSATSNTIIMNDIVLSVELTHFTGRSTEGGNLLTWATASEVNNEGFEVERLTDAGQWSILGFVKGNNKATTYEFLDKNPLETSYYRLRQIDNGGKETVSKVISIQNKGLKGALLVYPNPVSQTLNLDTEGGHFEIFNFLGQAVQRGTVSKSIDVSALPQGSYVLKVGTQHVKFVKE